ncbi:hypothetical protein I4U23_000048 [Adineta vaga]|nr:hypothetical protein I4U23_000048 [Adineta vaga]
MSSDDSERKTVGLGFRSPFAITAPFDRVWAAMLDKVYHADKYCPQFVKGLKTEDRSPTHVHREIDIHDQIRHEDVFLDEENGEMRFVDVDEDEVRVNKFHKNEQILEFWLENKKGKRIPWNNFQDEILLLMNSTRDFAMRT